MKLKENERIDDLQYKDLKIIQNEKAFCFGIDAVLLSDFAKGVKKESVVVDLCSGTGIVAIMLEAKAEIKKIYAVEIQKEMADMCSRSIALNNQQKKIKVLNEDLKNIESILGKASIDAITVNPPYKKVGSGIVNDTDTKSISRHEILCTLEDIIQVSSSILKVSGSLYMVHRMERLVDVIATMRKYKMEPKRIRFIHPTVSKAPNLFLVEGIKNAKPFLKIDTPIYVYDEEGNNTKTINEIYHIKNER